MAGSLVQGRATDSTASASSIALAFTSNNAAHNALWVVGQVSDSTNSQTVDDTQTNSYSAKLDGIVDGTDNNNLSHWAAVDSNAGANTVTVHFSPAGVNLAIYIAEITGVQNVTVDGHNGRNQVAPGTGTDAVTSNTAATTATDFLIGLSCEVHVGEAPNIGTGFTLDRKAWQFGTGLNFMTAEYQVSVAGTVSAKFTAVGATDNFNTVMALFKEALVGGARPPLPTITLGPGGQPMALVAAAPGLTPSYGAARWQQWENYPWSPAVVVASFDASLMAAISQQWPITVITAASVIASGMTPPDTASI